MTVKSEEDLTALKRIGSIVRRATEKMLASLRPGITTAELDDIGQRFLLAQGAKSAPKLAYDFPGWTCISVNDEAAHGIPGPRRLREGDLVNIDVSAELGGYWADTGASQPVGRPRPEIARLCHATRASLNKGLAAARAGRLVNRIGRAVEREAGRRGYRTLEGLAGHGVGRGIHEQPSVLNQFQPGDRTRLHKGLVITIEPFLTKGRGDVFLADDGWTLKTGDGALSAQYEHSLVVTDGRPIILT